MFAELSIAGVEIFDVLVFKSPATACFSNAFMKLLL